MRRGLKLATLLLSLLVVAALALLLMAGAPVAVTTLSGQVTDGTAPLAGALVRIQATEYETYTDDQGHFVLEDVPVSSSNTVVAWHQGYTFGWADLDGDRSSLAINLTPHHKVDHLDYEWDPSANCGECHPSYTEWKADAHGTSAQNPRFLTMYSGKNLEGKRSRNSNYDMGLPSAPDPDQPYYGPGFKVDYPNRDGNCAACHTPMASQIETQNGCSWNGCHMYETIDRSDELTDGVSPHAATGVASEGISCDFCHKIAEVHLDAETGLPDPEAPGIVSLSLLRPEPGNQFLMGTIDDVSRDRDSFNPLYGESQYCAACHVGYFGETLIYNSYGEWVESGYSGDDGQSCQDCHMPVSEPVEDRLAPVGQAVAWVRERTGRELPAPLAELAQRSGRSYFVYPEKEGVYRPAEQIHDHDMPGASDPEFLRSAVDLQATAETVDSTIRLNVDVTNRGAGHHLPTGSPLRQVILVVEPLSQSGETLPLLQGPLLPDWMLDLAGQPGRSFVKILRDEVTGEAPTWAQWRNVTVESDSRIPALETATTSFRFVAPADGAEIRVRLLYRRTPLQLQQWKGWSDEDILLSEISLTVDGE